MPFGKYKGRKMEDVPATYLKWLMEEPWIGDWPDVLDYLEQNVAAIEAELKDQGYYEGWER
jgi:uncharacterized protein (DUF3820 family)